MFHFQNTLNFKSDFNIVSDKKWLSPHYGNHYSSIPKKIVQKGHTVQINTRCKNDAFNILVVNSYVDLKSLYCTSTKNIILILPGARVLLPDGQLIKCQDIPLGFSKIAIGDNEISVKDFRNLLMKDGRIVQSPFMMNETYFIGTGSPSDINFSTLLND